MHNEWMESIRSILELSGMSQSMLADGLKVTCSAVKEWESGSGIPSVSEQERLASFCMEKEVPAIESILERIHSAASNLPLPGKRILLYHVSREGLSGRIAPKSRRHCDFGPGFYMASHPEPVLSLSCGLPDSCLYLVSLDLTGLKICEIQRDLDWMMLTAYHRGKLNAFKGSTLYQKYSRTFSGCDLVIGSTVDDRVFPVLDDFFAWKITDAAL